MSARAAKNFLRDTQKILESAPCPVVPSQWQSTASIPDQSNAAFCIIDLNDVWANFCRELVIDNASGLAKDMSGSPVVPVNRLSRKSVLRLVRNRNGFEPRWHAAKETVNAEKKCSSAKSRQIQSALFSVNSPAPFVNTVRNYFCHRRSDCRDTLGAHSAYNKLMNYNAYRIINFLRPDGRRNIEFWIEELRLIAIACAA